MQQRQLPLVLLAAGLPILPALVGDSKSYAERLFNFPDIGPLPESDAIKAVRDPIHQAGEAIEPAALAEIFRLTQGFPYFLQEWGYQVWNYAQDSPISLQVVQARADSSLSDWTGIFSGYGLTVWRHAKQRFLRAMAELGPGAQRTSDVADKLGVKIQTLGPLRASLFKKGMVYSPSHGVMAFTVPLFDEFMRRAIPVFAPS